MVVVDAANVVGSRPNGWWRDRAKAAAGLCSAIADAAEAARLGDRVVIVLEGAARGGVAERDDGRLRVAHAPGSGDDTIADLAADEQSVTVVTADRGLRDRVTSVGAEVVGPRWLLDRLDR